MANYYPEDKSTGTQFVKALGRAGKAVGKKLGITSKYQGGGSLADLQGGRQRTYKNDSGEDVSVTKTNDAPTPM